MKATPADRTTTIEQHMGNHHATGLRIVQLTTISTTHDAYALTDCPWERLSVDEHEWWDNLLARIHRAEVEMASLDADVRHRAEQLFESTGDLEDLPGCVRLAIKRAEDDES